MSKNDYVYAIKITNAYYVLNIKLLLSYCCPAANEAELYKLWQLNVLFCQYGLYTLLIFEWK